FLKNLGILEISLKDIEEISNLATNGKNIVFCNSKWQALEPNCYCGFNEITEESVFCVKCGAPAFNVEKPASLLSLKESSGNLDLTRILILVFGVIIALILIIYKSRPRKCCDSGEELVVLKYFE
ncbi:MAG: hypothetical protein QXL86_03500, partial [Candidatus Aenigmatarchaeota archaeon]